MNAKTYREHLGQLQGLAWLLAAEPIRRMRALDLPANVEPVEMVVCDDRDDPAVEVIVIHQSGRVERCPAPSRKDEIA